MKLINAATAAEKIAEKTDLQLNELVDIFAEIPEVELVCCEDCKFYRDNSYDDWNTLCLFWQYSTRPDEFCSHGRRKSE